MFKVCLCNATYRLQIRSSTVFSPKFKFTLNLCFIPDLCYNIALCYLKQYSASLKYITEIIERGIKEHPGKQEDFNECSNWWSKNSACLISHLQSGDQHWVLSANDEGERLKACAILASSVATLIKVFLLPGCSLIPLSMISVMYLSEAEYCFSL